MKHKSFILCSSVLVCLFSFLTQNLFATLFVQGTQSHFVFMDESAKVNLQDPVPVACPRSFLVKDSNKYVTPTEYDYSEASTFLCELVVNNSDWIAAHGDHLIDTSNALVTWSELIVENSDTIVKTWELAVDNSNWIVESDDVNCCDDVAVLQGKMDFIDSWSVTIDHGPGNIDINITTSNLIYDLWLSKHHILNVDTSSFDVTLDGATHFIHFARETAEPTGTDPMLLVDGAEEFILTNVVLKDFSPHYIGLTSGASILFGDGTTIEMANNDTIDTSYTMTFEGVVRLKCFDYEFDLSGMTWAFDILPSSTLIIENARITGLSQSKIRCLAQDATLALIDCTLVLEDTYSFTEGYLNIYHDVEIEGMETFAYKSPQPLTIHDSSQLKIDLSTTFSYDSGLTPANAGNNRLVMVDDTSKLFLSGCTLHVTTTGLQLTKGTLIIDHIVTVESEGSNVLEAVVWGNGIQADNLSIEVMPGGNWELISGYLSYQNDDS